MAASERSTCSKGRREVCGIGINRGPHGTDLLVHDALDALVVDAVNELGHSLPLQIPLRRARTLLVSYPL